MTKQEMTALILDARKRAKVSWAALAELVGAHEVWVTSCCYGENSMPEPFAGKLCSALSLPDGVRAALADYPLKGQSLGQAVPSDPLVYRFYEIMQVYGLTLKELIQEKFGDGIMSAIDFTMDIQKEQDPKGDRVVVTMNGKFLPYKKW
ncbi:MAG TPA: cyanase [Polyangiaceae bacterium]|nr:cyanase [Polyangiaceae bacterium]